MDFPWSLHVAVSLLLLFSQAGTSHADSPTFNCTSWSSSEDTCEPQDDGSYLISTTQDGRIGMLYSDQYFYHGVFSVFAKLQSGNSAGLCVAFYLIDTQSQHNTDENHFEIDLEIYGAPQPEDVMLASNIFFSGQQYLVQFHLPFDATADYHNYTILWSQNKVAWLVDGTVYRVLNEEDGKPWPNLPLWPLLTVWSPGYANPKPDFSNGSLNASVMTGVLSGCGYTTATPDSLGDCPSWTGTDLPWNRDLQLSSGPSNFASSSNTSSDYVRSATLLNDYGWDTAS